MCGLFLWLWFKSIYLTQGPQSSFLNHISWFLSVEQFCTVVMIYPLSASLGCIKAPPHTHTHSLTWNSPPLHMLNIRTSSDVWSLHHPCKLLYKAVLWSLFITSKRGRDVSITRPDVQISRVVSALTVPSLPRPKVYLRRGALAAGGSPG